MKKIGLICLSFLLWAAVCFADGIEQPQELNVNYTGIGGEKISFDYEDGSSQVVVKNKMVKGKPIDIILTLAPAPDNSYQKRVLSLKRIDVADRSFWYLKAYWAGPDASPSGNSQFWLIGRCKDKIVPFATEKILGKMRTYDTFSIIAAQAYRKTTASGVFDPVPVLVVDRFSSEFDNVDTTVLYWDAAAEWFAYTGKYLYPYPIYVDGKKID